ncbi:SIR2 family protein [Rhodococcus sp. 06-418-5]|uniref:SIR2 family protein n=1 Tax=Rhodococcus sp. 06-418-5 TaxID=2022507 RepID=UPI0015C59433|nr:SIR2 family protein [Rhodococcus sp. 06-418-5]
MELPEKILEAARSRNLVIFAGAGISTETPAVFPRNFYQSISEELGLSDSELSFPDVMQKFQDKFGRVSLIQKLKDRLSYIDSFRSTRYESKKFHRELATMPYLVDIITTNWDDSFETECAATPFVVGEDFAYQGVLGRKVYKMHGSISLLSSIVITESDYKKSLHSLSSNVLGSSIRQMMATRTVVFIGYSLSDWNFNRIYSALKHDMGDYWTPSYVVSPFDNPNINSQELLHIRTSGQQFLVELKGRMLEEGFIPDAQYAKVADALDELAEAIDIVSRYPASRHPTIVHCWAYQEGLRDALARIIDLRPTGSYSDCHHVSHLIQSYLSLVQKAIGLGEFFNAAYMDGYLAGLLYLIDADSEFGPLALYYIYGSDSEMRSIEELELALQQSRRRAPKPRAEARRLAQGVPDGMVLHHGPRIRVAMD